MLAVDTRSIHSGSRKRKLSRLSRPGCLTCRARNRSCEATSPACDNCLRTGRDCFFEDFSDGWHVYEQRTSAGSVETPLGSVHGELSTFDAGDYFPADSASQGVDPQAPLSTLATDLIAHYTSKFDQYNYQLCAWTNLIALPRRSTIPTILTIPARRGKKANWATFYLPHLSMGTAEDSLSVAISAFTSLRMGHLRTATELYLRAIALLRVILAKKNSNKMDNLAFLRLWSTTLLLAEYEGQMGNQTAQYHHLAGATTLSEVAEYRFPRLLGTLPGFHHSGDTASPDLSDIASQSSLEQSQLLQVTPDRHAETGSGPSTPDPRPESRTERDLPNYLLALNRRLNHSKAIRLSQDTHWPSFHTPADRHSIGALHEKTSEIYRLVMPLVATYYALVAKDPPKSREDERAIQAMFAADAMVARDAITAYQTMAHKIYGNENRVFQSCARPGFPFSPVLKFVDPQAAQPSTTPHVMTMFLAPFITEAEHHEAIRHISGVFAGFQDVPGLLIDASFPDIHVAAFWRRGPERDYFHEEMVRRGGDFRLLLTRIWGTIDYAAGRQGKELNPTQILGISLREYSRAQGEGMKLKNTRH